MATRPKAVIESRNGEKFSPITIAKNVLTDDGQNLHDILSDRKEDIMTPTIENSSSMFKVGQGDNVDYSNNVINGAYESMVLKGKTMVNCIQESSSKDVVLPYEFEEGRYVTINDTKESGALGIELKGQTLVNLAQSTKSANLNGEYVFRDNFEILNFGCNMIKPSTTYTIISNIIENSANFLNLEWNTTLDECAFKEIIRTDGSLGIRKFKVTSKDDLSNASKSIRFFPNNKQENGTLTITFMILEGDYTNIDIPYFEGMTSCKIPTLHTVGKNLFDKEAFYNDWKSKKDTYVYKEIVDNEEVLKVYNLHHLFKDDMGFRINVKKGVPLTLKMECKMAGTKTTNSVFTIRYDDKKYLDFPVCKSDEWVASTITFVPTRDYITFCSGYGVDDYHYIKNIQLEEGRVATACEPYKSSILSLPEDLELRGIGNVKDTLDLRIGKLTRYIKEFVLDGTQDLALNVYKQNDSYITFHVEWNNFVDIIGGAGGTQNSSIIGNSKNYISNNFVYNGSAYSGEGEGILFDPSANLFIGISKEKLVSNDTKGFKEYLKNNPFILLYRMGKPVISTISLAIKNQDNQAVSKLLTFNETTHISTSTKEGSLIPTISHSNPSYPVILKPSTKYSIVANSYSNGHTNSAINFNLGGATASTTVGSRVTTITTPSTLSNELLTMSGCGNKLNNVMVIEGDVAGDLPYFEGICDCKSPILLNCGKNLYPVTYLTDNTYVDKIRLKANTRYTLKNSVAFSPQNRFKFRVYDLKQNPLNDSQLVEIHKDLYYNRASVAFCNNGNKDYIECSFTPKIDCYISITSFNSGVDSNRDYHIQLEEGSTVTTYEPYKSNILSANGDKIELTEDMFEEGGIGGHASHLGKTYEELKSVFPSSLSGKRLMTVDLVKVKPNTSYSINSSDNFAYFACSFNANKIANGGTDTGYVKSTIFTTSSDTHYIAIIVKRDNDGLINMLDFKNNTFTLSEVDKTIVLRSLPNGVCDTLNVETGEYVQRIGEVVLDGTETNWSVTNEAGWENTPNTIAFGLTFTPKALAYATDVTSSVVCDKFSTITADGTWGASGADKEGISINQNSRFDIRIERTKLPDESLTGFKQWLSQNPITVQYELEVSIVKTVDLSGFPFSYENGHVILSSGSIEQSLTPKVEYSVVTNRNGQIRSNQKMVERHQKQLDRLQAMILTNLVNTQYEQTLTNLKYDLKNVREEVK